MKRYAVGVIVKDRWELTRQTLTSLVNSDQTRDSYDLFIIDNGSDTANLRNLKDFVKASMLPLKGMVCLPPMDLGKACNLFMALTRNYDFRVKMDNDIVLHGTNIKPAVQKVDPNAPKPSDYGTNPGAIPSGPPIRGLGQAQSAMTRRANQKKSHTKFLQHMTDFSSEYQVDISALLPVDLKKTFLGTYNDLVTRTWNGGSFLSGACMMISKACFDKIGYFHDMLPCHIDVEYSQRAIRNDIKVGYHQSYGVVHAGSKSPTWGEVQKYTNEQKSLNIIQNHPIETKSQTQWETAIHDIEQACLRDRILHLL